ncbi:MAG: cell division protein FtsZ, partial [Candidatus Dadabacteria bacterium]|nr:cell division protein FtsZ [Candidatus Dadabacteria bacterium]
MASFRIEHVENSSRRARIKVLGTGGAGGNAVNTMISKGLKEVEFVAVNTDFQDLTKSLAPTKLQIGESISRGLGSGGSPQLAKEAAMDDRDKISDVIGEADMVFITAGMGGGT